MELIGLQRSKQKLLKSAVLLDVKFGGHHQQNSNPDRFLAHLNCIVIVLLFVNVHEYTKITKIFYDKHTIFFIFILKRIFCNQPNNYSFIYVSFCRICYYKGQPNPVLKCLLCSKQIKH